MTRTGDDDDDDDDEDRSKAEIFFSTSSILLISLIPLPPPPQEALSISGKPIFLAILTSSSLKKYKNRYKNVRISLIIRLITTQNCCKRPHPS